MDEGREAMMTAREREQDSFRNWLVAIAAEREKLTGEDPDAVIDRYLEGDWQ